MPLRNRVLPTGEIVAIPARGALTGNRGVLHDANRQLKRRWTTHAWIACRLDWQGRRRVPMTPGTWTELFFLDEAVALAAGHRPCAYCRRPDYMRFRDAWGRAFGGVPKAPEMDAVLHPARLETPATGPWRDQPDGVFLRHEGRIGLLWRDAIHAYAPEAYGATLTFPAEVELLTPAPMRQVLAAGYDLAVPPKISGPISPPLTNSP